MNGSLIGVGVGPGDPDLVTLRGLRVVREADEVFVPVDDPGEIGRAETVLRSHLRPGGIRRLLFSPSGDEQARAKNWERAAREVAVPLGQGKRCAFATIGDPNVYSTFTYLARAVRKIVPKAQIETVPGITAMQDLASKGGTVLLEGDERLALLPFTAGRTLLKEALAGFETVVCYKGGNRLTEVLGAAEEAGRLDGAIYGSRLGMEGEEVRAAEEMIGKQGTYFSTVIFTGRRRDL